MFRHLLRWPHPLLVLATLALLAACSNEDQQFARVAVVESMAQTIGGPTAGGRPGDFLLENDRIRAIVHGAACVKPTEVTDEAGNSQWVCPAVPGKHGPVPWRHNKRGTFPISNGSLIDLDIQRPQHQFSAGKGRDAFYEMGSMVNLKVNSSREMKHGACGEVGAAPCPSDDAGKPLASCMRVSARGPGEDIMGILGLLDFAIKKQSYKSQNLEVVTDYDICPGEPLVRTTTTVRYFGASKQSIQMEPLEDQTSLLAVLLGETTDVDCSNGRSCPAGTTCEDLLINVDLGTLKTEMKRCRGPEQKLAGVMAGDFMLFSGKVHVFIPGSGFDHETYIRSVFDTGGDIFSAPLALDYVAAVGDGVSYVYFGTGKAMIPVFAESFTVAMTNRFACSQKDADCMNGKELRFGRFVSVGQGDVASALAGYYQARGIPTGRIEGHVIDSRTSQPISGIGVFALRLPTAWHDLDDAAIGAHSYDELVAANREETKSAQTPLGEVGIVSQFRTDVGLDAIPDGSFGGQLPAGRYVLVARDRHRATSRLIPVRIEVDHTTSTSVISGEPGRLQFDLQDTAGRHLPGKLTIGHCFPECARDEDCSGSTPVCDTTTRLCMPAGGGYGGAGDCRPDQVWDDKAGTCRCLDTGRLPLELGGSRYADGTVRTVLTAHGTGEVELPAGTYQVLASRGIEYETQRQFVTLRPGAVTRVQLRVSRVVDSDGWISADFHVHGANSVDSPLDAPTRVTSYAAEGVELLTATDHDQLTNYAPTVYQLALQPWLKSQVGVEVSPLDYGHFLGFPLTFDETAELNGSFHWRDVKTIGEVSGEGAQQADWQNLAPKAIYERIRLRGALGPDETVVAVAHFYDHFTFYGVDPWTLELPVFSLNAMLNPVLSALKFSGEFDALEAFNGKNLDVIRRPTWQEVRHYNVELGKVLGDTSKPYAERQKAWAALSAASQRDYMIRTPEEQAKAIAFSNLDFECRCTADEDCGPGFLCDERTGGCLRGCSDDDECDQTLVTSGREKCLPRDPSDPNRKSCQRVTPNCSVDPECTVTWGSHTEACLAIDDTQPTTLTCELPCTSDSDCRNDAKRPVCGGTSAAKHCQARVVTAAVDADPCPTVRGTLDDWFQMLNHGMRRTVLGNSDSHSTYGIEAGLPRNYVRSSSDLAGGIDLREVASNVKAGHTFATYGPFVQFSINGQPVGATVSVNRGEHVSLEIKVQSPRWFDVDRLEIYRNGQLWGVINGQVDCPPGDANCIKVPNDGVVNYQQTLPDTPERDSWYVVVAMGVDGKTMAPVYSSTPVARLGIFELIQRLTPLLPPLRSLRTPFSPSITTVRPYAVTNPIWVDVGGDGLEPLNAPPSWATARDKSQAKATAAATASQSSGLRQSTPAASQSDRGYGHDHRQGLGRMRTEASGFVEALRQGHVTPRMLQQAMDSLRYLR